LEAVSTICLAIWKCSILFLMIDVTVITPFTFYQP